MRLKITLESNFGSEQLDSIIVELPNFRENIQKEMDLPLELSMLFGKIINSIFTLLRRNVEKFVQLSDSPL